MFGNSHIRAPFVFAVSHLLFSSQGELVTVPKGMMACRLNWGFRGWDGINKEA